jgi:hypothetical protein
MQRVAQTTAPFTPKAFYATYAVATGEGTTDHHGGALRDAAGRVWFRYDTTHMWTELFNHDAAALLLHGECALVEEARHWDELHQDIYQPCIRYPRLAA